MKKMALVIVFISFIVILTGCYKHQRFMVEKPGPDVFEQMTPSAAAEVALAEEVAQKRLAYRKELEKIKSFYEQSGNQLKLEWVQRELASLDSAPRYRYIIQAEVAGDKLAATDSIPRANILYDDAEKLYKEAEFIPLLVSRSKRQLALNKCNELIRDYPASDKIDDAAYMAGEIHEFFGDYSIAVLYYKRAFQWDADTPYPARYRAAKLLDYKLFERDQALQLYRESLKRETAAHNYSEIMQQRIDELTIEPASVKIK
jgi:TolA-binding protein